MDFMSRGVWQSLFSTLLPFFESRMGGSESILREHQRRNSPSRAARQLVFGSSRGIDVRGLRKPVRLSGQVSEQVGEQEI